MKDPNDNKSIDPVVEAYKKDIDLTLIRENLKLSHQQRLEKLIEMQRFAEELRKAGSKMEGKNMSENQNSNSRKIFWLGWILSAVPILMLLMSASMKFMQPAEFAEGLKHLGWDAKTMIYIGVVELLCVVLYAIPKTAVFGAILIAAYLGGATATHVRVGDAFIIPVLLGIVAWLGLWLRDKRLRELLPLS